MAGRTTLILLILTMLTGAYIVLVDRRLDATEEARERARLAVRIHPERVSHLRVLTRDVHVHLVRDRNRWTLTNPVEARADAERVERILEELSRLRRGEVITLSQQKSLGLTPADYGLDDPRLRLFIATPAHTLNLWVGRDTPLGDGLYVKREDHPEIFVLPRSLLAQIPTTLLGWRDRSLFAGSPTDVRRINIQRREDNLRIARAETGGWTLQLPHAARAANPAVQDLIERLYQLRIEDFIAETTAAASLYGLADPVAEISILTAQNPSEQILRIGREVDQQPHLAYAMLRGDNSVFAIPRSILDTLSRPASEFRDRRLLHLPTHTLNSLVVTEGETTLRFTRTQGPWTMVEPKPLEVNPLFMDTHLAAWDAARVDTFIDVNGTNAYQPFGLEPPHRLITFQAPAPNGGESDIRPPQSGEGPSVTVALGAPATNRPGIYARRMDEPGVFILPSELTTLSVHIPDYRKPEILSLAPQNIRSLRTITPAGETGIEWSNGTLSPLPATSGFLVNTQAWLSALDLLSSVQASSYIAEDPRDLSAYGLDEPFATLVIGLAGEADISKSILFARPPDDLETVYAMVRGGEVVFIMEPQQQELLLQPWATPPATP